MTAPFILVKSYKSTGIAILLTLLFGPIGLFYASVLAGITMTFLVPILLVLFILVSKFIGTQALEFSLLFTFVVIIFYWLICIVWAAVAVNSYNRKIEEEYARQQQISNELKRYPVQPAPQIAEKGHTGSSSQVITGKPGLQDWLKENPAKGINDYFIKFGTSPGNI